MASPSRAPRIGVIGAGGLGVHHVRILRDLAGDGFVGFFDANPARAAEVAASLGVPTLPSEQAVIEAADAVSIVVPTSAHHRVAAAALDAGRHVFVEKPFTVTLDEADDLLARQRRAGVVVQVGHVERVNRAIRAARPYIDGPRFIESERLAPFSLRGADVAVVLDLMIHDIDLVQTLVGAAVDDVAAIGIPVLTPQVDIANAHLTFANGAVANVTASRVSRERVRKLRIFQPSGYLTLDLAAGRGDYFRLRAGLDPQLIMRGEMPAAAAAAAFAATGRTGGAPTPSLDQFVEHVPLEAEDAEPLRLELSQFLDAITGRAPVAVSGEEGREALALALRIMTAIEASVAATVGSGAAARRA